jgi:hypothetical protein
MNRGGEFGRDKNPACQRLAQGLDPSDLVDRRPDDRKVETVDSADVAIKHLAEMEREIDHSSRFAHPRSVGVEPVEIAHRFGGGIKRTAAGFVAGRVDKGEARKHTVAKKLQHLAAARTQRSRQNLECIVEHIDENRTRRSVSDWGEAADIGVPEDGANALD